MEGLIRKSYVRFMLEQIIVYNFTMVRMRKVLLEAKYLQSKQNKADDCNKI